MARGAYIYKLKEHSPGTVLMLTGPLEPSKVEVSIGKIQKIELGGSRESEVYLNQLVIRVVIMQHFAACSSYTNNYQNTVEEECHLIIYQV